MIKKKEKIIDPLKDKKSKKVAHYNAVLIESLHSELRAISEKVMSSEERITQKMDEKFAEQDQKVGDMQLVLKTHSQTLNKIESKLDKVIEKVEEHEQKIQEIKIAPLAY